jgi:hypothetical protein
LAARTRNAIEITRISHTRFSVFNTLGNVSIQIAEPTGLICKLQISKNLAGAIPAGTHLGVLGVSLRVAEMIGARKMQRGSYEGRMKSRIGKR